MTRSLFSDDSGLTLTMKITLGLRGLFECILKVSGTYETVAADPYPRHPFESVSYHASSEKQKSRFTVI